MENTSKNTATNSYNCKGQLTVGDKTFEIMDQNKLPSSYNVARLPFCLKILVENLLRCEDGVSVHKKDIQALLNWSPKAIPQDEISFTPARVILQDFTGVPAIVDLAAMRDAMQALGDDPKRINPLSPVDLVIDHSVMVDYFGNAAAFEHNVEREFQRNIERYALVHGPVCAADLLELQPKASVEGDVSYKALEMHQGATMTGKLQPIRPDAVSDNAPLKLASSNG